MHPHDMVTQVILPPILYSAKGTFKFYAHSQGEDDIVIYIGHGTVTMKMKQAVREWETKRGIKQVNWGREKKINRAAKVQ